MKRALFIFCFLISTLPVFSQEGFMKGYVIKNQGDTVRGKIKDRKWYNSVVIWQKIEFINEKGEKYRYTADDLKGYVKSDSLQFRTLMLGVEARNRFVTVIETGPIVLFADIKGSSSKVQVKPSPFGTGVSVNLRVGESSQNIQGEYYLQRQADKNSLMEWRDKDYKVTAAYFFKEDKELMQQITNETLLYGDIQLIVKKYNEWKAKQP